MSTLSKTILSVCLLFSSLMMLQAQNEDQNYLAGAVPEVDGKVTFSETIQTKHNSDQIYQIIEKWAEDQRQVKDKFYDYKIIYNDTLKHELAMLISERLIFSSSALSLDYTVATYYLIFEIANNECDVVIKGIKYKYADNKDMITADEMISDRAALNKEKTKMYREHNKFRIATVNMADDTFEQLEQALNKDEYDAIKINSRTRRNIGKSNNTSNNTVRNNGSFSAAEAEDLATVLTASETSSAKANTIEVVNLPATKDTPTIEEVSTIVEETGQLQAAPIKDKTVLNTELEIAKLAQQKAFALNNFFIVGENMAYVRQVSALSVEFIDGKASIVCYLDNDGTILQQSQIMPSGKFKIMYYTPNSNSYNKLAELSKKYAKGEPYSDADITMIEVLVENANDAFRCNRLKIETISTNSISSKPTIENMPAVGKFIKTNKTVVITGNLID